LIEIKLDEFAAGNSQFAVDLPSLMNIKMEA